ncbi:hypothetical protein ACH4UM_14410 [Streptomyces sp. NPDC020801]
MPSDPYAVLRTLLRAEAVRRSTPETRPWEARRPEPGEPRPSAPGEPERG